MSSVNPEVGATLAQSVNEELCFGRATVQPNCNLGMAEARRPNWHFYTWGPFLEGPGNLPGPISIILSFFSPSTQ